jgi:hypothetical protein
VGNLAQRSFSGSAPAESRAVLADAHPRAEVSLVLLQVVRGLVRWLPALRARHLSAIALATRVEDSLTPWRTDRGLPHARRRDALHHRRCTDRAHGVDDAALATEVAANASPQARRGSSGLLMPGAALRALVVGVRLCIAKKEMVRIHTGRVVAPMADLLPRRNLAAKEQIRCSVRGYHVIPVQREAPVLAAPIITRRAAYPIAAPGPLPAPGERVDAVFLAEALQRRRFHNDTIRLKAPLRNVCRMRIAA